MSFAIVVDSTCDWNPAEYQDRQVTMVPLKVDIDGDVFYDQTEISSEEFYDRMNAAKDLPKTSQPAPYDFVQVYNDLAAQGYDHIVSIHIAEVLSGTSGSALIAADQVDVDVSVIDSCGATVSAGLVVQKACELRDAGVDFADAVAQIKEAVSKARFFVACDTLENLLRGGRLSAEQVDATNLLNIKPIFTFDDRGVFGPCDKAKGMKGVIKRYVEIIEEQTAQSGTLRIRFCHARNAEGVEKVKQALSEAGVDYIDEGTSKCGAIIATHLGMGALGFGILPA